jgi:hypothetical protein
MTTVDQGWMVDDGTCTPCLRGNCHRCADPQDDGAALICCCDEGHMISSDPLDEWWS